MQGALCPLADYLSCVKCKQVLADRIHEVVVQWALLKVCLHQRGMRLVILEILSDLLLDACLDVGCGGRYDLAAIPEERVCKHICIIANPRFRIVAISSPIA